MTQNTKDPFKAKSFKYILAGGILLVIAGMRWLDKPHEIIYNTVETLLAVGLIVFGAKLSKDEKKK
ncbi:hypothetical protein CKG00_01155 [Morganella morganii]|uniref:Uncharacterized protein n=1 Tax=Morganella morganii TaxID=582 RepID=A0A433ZSR7_MORMO|nr:hypothetical protein [Morganella morganii]RUT65167.1 hypothetical protein CKG00_01155 [Morganella morganii]